MPTSPAKPARGNPTTWFANLSAYVKILTAVCLAALLALAVGITGLHALSTTDGHATDMYEDNFLGLDNAAQLQRLTLQERLDVANAVISQDAASKRKYREAALQTETQLKAAIAEAQGRNLDAPHREQIAVFADQLTKYLKIRDEQLLPASDRNDIAGWQLARDRDGAPVIEAMMGALEAIVTDEVAGAKAAAAATSDTYGSNRRSVLVLLVLGILGAIAIGALIARSIVGNLRQVERVAQALAVGDLTQQTGLTSSDEVGRLGQSVDAAIADLRLLVNGIAADSHTLNGAAAQLTEVSAELGSGAEEAAERAQRASAAAEDINGGVQNVATGSGEMSTSINEIAKSAGEAAEVARQAMDVAANTTAQVAQLGEASAEIGSVVNLITSIAEQTNLLALNATIEAARAGDAGKGFAVVASEVKDLAQQTARATDDISVRIHAIQDSSGGAAQAIGEIREVITRIGDYTTTIASAVEEQSATTTEMGRSIARTATGSGEIAQTVAGVAEVASATADAARATNSAAEDLTQLSRRLDKAVASFTF